MYSPIKLHFAYVGKGGARWPLGVKMVINKHLKTEWQKPELTNLNAWCFVISPDELAVPG